MNGSRSNTPNNGAGTSLDQLNRTIEGLEARIQGLIGDRRAPANRMPSRTADPMTEILERQKALGGARERVNAVMEQRRPRMEQPQQPASWAQSAPVAPAPTPLDNAALREITTTLAQLRAELKHEFADGISRDLGIIHSEMQDLKSAAVNGGSHAIRNDLLRLADSIERLEAGEYGHRSQDLRADLDELRSILASTAREDSVRSLERRWASTEDHLAAFDPNAVREELVQLAWRIDGLKSGLGELSAAPAVRALEDKLIAIANSIETLGHEVRGRDVLVDQFAGLDQRLDEISRAIAASARQNTAQDSPALQRLENRIAELAEHIDFLGRQPPKAEIADRIAGLTARIDEIAHEEEARNLEGRIANLTALIERGFQGQSEPGLSNHLADISRKIDGLGGNQIDNLVDRLEMLSRRIEELEIPAPAHPASAIDTSAIARLEHRLTDIAHRLDESIAAPQADTGALRSLEQQIASLSSLLARPEANVSNGLPDLVADRMAALEDYMATSDEFIVEAARQAAEAVVEAYSRSGVPNAGNSTDISAIAGLAEDLRALEEHTRASEERTHDTFEALHQTLVQIAGRLDNLGQQPAPVMAPIMAPATAAQPLSRVEDRYEFERERAAAPMMPKATQPEFLNEPLALSPEPPRKAPENPKVAVFDESELELGNVGADIPDIKRDANRSAAPVPPASKSLLAGLAAKLKPGKKDKAASTDRVSVAPPPPLDASDMVIEEEPNLLLEPGSGVPDVKKIMEKVRAGRQPETTGAPAGGHPDVIAAARRAAQAAVAEASQSKAPAGKDKAKPAAKDKNAKASGVSASENRRPILLAAAAVLLVVMSYPLVSNLIGGRGEAPAPELPQSTQNEVPANMDGSVAPAEPAAADKATTDVPATTDSTVKAPESDMLAPADLPPKTPDTPNENGALTPPADTDAAKAEPLAATPDIPTATDAKTAPEPVPAAAIELPEGLQPASLAEAAKRGDALAYFEIGSRFTDGRGVKVDLAQAAKWYAAAAEKGLAPAEYRLANFYEKGTGVERDLDKAKTLYLSAAAKGNASAMHNLAVIFATGTAGTPDFNEAAKWFQAAAEHNVRDSQFNLAILYARGNGVKQDLGESYKWFAIAAREGDQDAAQKRDEVANALTPEQLSAAKAKLDLWQPTPLDDNANTAIVPDEWIAKGNTTATIDMRRAIRNIQAILNNNGFDAGAADGSMGKKTVAAIKAFQKSVGQEPTGRIDDALVRALLARNKKS
ncbi:MAG: hypothetical protein RLZZ444_2182 [Pseudomonadota bacterium]